MIGSGTRAIVHSEEVRRSVRCNAGKQDSFFSVRTLRISGDGQKTRKQTETRATRPPLHAMVQVSRYRGGVVVGFSACSLADPISRGHL